MKERNDGMENTSLCTCSACGRKAAFRTVSAKNVTEPDGRRAAMIRTRTRCSACFAEVDWGMKIVETLKRDERTVIPMELPNSVLDRSHPSNTGGHAP